MNDELRPSRIQDVCDGKLFWTEVDILNIGDEVTALRAGLETFGLKVNLINCGQGRHIVQALGKSDSKAEFIIINAHGDDDGSIVLPELGESVAKIQPFNNRMTPEDLAKFVDVQGKIIICTACGGGHEKLARVFLELGQAKAYIGDSLAPFGYASYLFPILIFYFLTQYPTISIKQAFERAQQTDPDEFKSWVIFVDQ